MPDDLFAALVDSLPPREDRDPDAPLFQVTGDQLRTAMSRSCRHAAVPRFSPHALRRRRGSLLEKQGLSLAEVGEVLGDTKVITAEHYVYALGDYREVDRARLLALR